MSRQLNSLLDILYAIHGGVGVGAVVCGFLALRAIPGAIDALGTRFAFALTAAVSAMSGLPYAYAQGNALLLLVLLVATGLSVTGLLFARYGLARRRAHRRSKPGAIEIAIALLSLVGCIGIVAWHYSMVGTARTDLLLVSTLASLLFARMVWVWVRSARDQWKFEQVVCFLSAQVALIFALLHSHSFI